ncbi:RNA polymerase-associated protein RapA [Legionella waltersii]|uniref:RNA polymerase-associated protein RapA n=1 Tax=Legionella waltersii TaxID=66969 RepID=A0A0W1AGN0_9GAMM|nr:RNA polymerase-associated protein RapA [Legionella waltersii]KTD80533.1 RNA polymerase-associated protein HepA [Legionella waltersii]SNV09397.1 RNA polymerase-associated protein HepA [Legionella waltersii]
MTYTIGQRWISNTETQLGLGIITDFDRRQVCLSFPAVGEERIYSTDNPPLSRIIYKAGDEITTNQQERMEVISVNENKGIVFYSGQDKDGNEISISELALSSFIKLNTPQQRLSSGIIDKLDSFKLRVDTIHLCNRLQQSKIRGLIGSRTSHLTHQVYIAQEVGQRFAPRVMLADEVGLGKTIEAGMILHSQLQTARANRVLIVVPDSLIHQWLVEMLRRFNLQFSIIDETRYEQQPDELTEDDEEGLSGGDWPEQPANLFESEQLVLTSLDFLMSNDIAQKHVIESDWDLLVVDEAHHLHWSENEISPEYLFIEQLAKKSKGLLLLTATPEQAGIESHFSRLRLIDPARFYTLQEFVKEENQYQTINEIVQQLLISLEENLNHRLNTKEQTLLKPYLDNPPETAQEAISQLLDRYGTGRVLFRNTRATIKGFPIRVVHSYPLPCPAIYNLEGEDISTSLYPESAVKGEEWIKQDPRVHWLIDKITELFPKKILVICASKNTAQTLEHHIKLKTNIQCADFHEGLSIIERDRAAAYFADEEQGAQALICSEIGSEGRNFQFAHHLVLFDLPLNPDLLEQRIGRLDRIGQKHPIQIHVPYLINTAQEKLFVWFQEGLNNLQQSCSYGFSIYELYANKLLPVLTNQKIDSSSPEFKQLIDETRDSAKKIKESLNKGRNPLLELNSCNAAIGQELIQSIEAEENCLELQNYMGKVYQEFGIDHEYHSEDAEILHPGNHMKTSYFPGLQEDGMTVTYSRLKALVREDMEFLSWEHPMVFGAMEMILESELGNATIATISIKNIQPGTLFLESLYTIHCAAPKALQLDRFLSLNPIRVLMDISGKNLSHVLSFEQLNGLCTAVKPHIAYPIIKQIQDQINTILSQSNQMAELQMQEILSRAESTMNASLLNEINRLEALKRLNPTIREEELDYLRKQKIDSELHINASTLKLQAVRVIINK